MFKPQVLGSVVQSDPRIHPLMNVMLPITCILFVTCHVKCYNFIITLALKAEESLTQATSCTNLAEIALSEISWKRNDKHHVIPLTRGP